MSEYNISNVFYAEDGSLVFNKASIVSPETEKLTTKYYDDKISSYLPITGGKIYGDLEFDSEASLVFGNTTQTQAFDENAVTQLSAAVNDTSQIFYSAQTNTTSILGHVSIPGTIALPVDALEIANIENLQSSLNTLNNSISAVAADVATNTTAISQLESDLEQTNTNVASNLAAIQSLQTDVSANTTLINEHTLDIEDINDSLAAHGTHLTGIDGEISDINSALGTKVDTTDFTNYQSEINLKITELSYDPSSNTTTFANDLHADNFEANDATIHQNLSCMGSFSISNNDYEVTTQQFGFLKDLDENVKVKLTALSEDILTNTNDISTHGTTISSHSVTIQALENETATFASRMDAAEGDIDALESATSVLSSYGSRLDGIDVSLAAMESDISGKQAVINSSNKLSASLIGDGLIANDEFATLNGILTTETIQHQINTITSSIQSLTGLQDIDITDIDALQSSVSTLETFATNQATTNSSVSSSISSLQSGKQNAITSGSKLSSELVSFGMSNVNAQIENVLINIGSLQSFQTSAQTTLGEYATFKSAQESYNSSNDTAIAAIESQLENVAIYDASNNLSAAFVSMSYAGSAYDGIISDSSVKDQLIEIRDAQALSHSQLITSIETKQNLIGPDESMIPVAYINGNYLSYSNTSLDSILGHIGDDMNGKQSILSSSAKLTSDYVAYDGGALTDTLSAIETDVGTLLDFKTSQESYNTSNDSAISIINSSLSGKQSTISTDSKLASTLISTSVNSTNGILSNVLQSITDINTSQSSSIASHTDDLTALSNQLASAENSISTINTNITSLQSQDTSHSNSISELSDAIDLKQDIISGTNLISGDYISTLIGAVSSDVNSVLNDIDADLNAIDTALASKQSTLNSTSNKLPISYVDLSGSSLFYVDISSNLSTQLTNIKNDILTLNGLQEGDVTSFTNINTELTGIAQDLTDLDTAIQTKMPIIDASNRLNANLIATGEVTNTKFNFLKNVTSDIQTQIDGLSGGGGGGGSSIPSITYDASNNVTEIENTTLVTTLKFAGDSSQQTTAFTSAKNTDLSDCKTRLTDVSYATNKTTIANNLECNNITGTTISDINSAIDLKQDILDASSNTLNPSYITGGSSLTSQKITWLSSIAQDLQTKLNSLQSSIDALVTADSSQTTTNTDLTNAINTLTTDKQDLLDGTNKLNSAYLNAGTGTMSNLKMQYLSSIGGDITDALASKWDTPSNAANLAHVDVSSSLSSLLSGKQATIADGDLSISKTSSLQSTLDAKQPFIKTINDIGTGLTAYFCTTSDLYTNICAAPGTGHRNIILPPVGDCPVGSWITITNYYSTTTYGIVARLYNGSGATNGNIQATLYNIANNLGGVSRTLATDGTRWYAV